MTTDIKIVFQPSDSESASDVAHKIDIVFVHGLNPRGELEHAEKTWTHEDGTMWPRDLLSKKIPYARIMIFAYNSNVARDVSESGMRQHANSLLDLVQGIRENTNTKFCPLILVGYSLGGLVIKQALLLAKHNDRVYGELRKSTKALVFFATPHRGGNGTTLGQIAVNAATFFSGNIRNNLVESLKKSSKYLTQLSADFSHQYEDYDYISIVETRALMRAPVRTIVVDSDSAILGLAGHREQVVELDKDHKQICKLTQNSEFNRVARHLKRLSDSAIQSVALPDQNEAAQGSLDLDPSSGDAVGGAPPPTANLTSFSTIDFMRQEELIGQAQILQTLESFVDNKRGQYLLLKGAAGTGKSSIVFEVASRYQGRISIFWFSAESAETLQQGLDRASYELHPELPKSHRQAALSKWLSNNHNGGWILIFDNAHIGLDLRGIVPPNKGKVIITSRHTDVRTHEGPTIKDVPALSLHETGELFLSKWEWLFYLERRHHTLPSSLSPLMESLHDRPLAAVLAASCVASMPLRSAQEHLKILYAEDVSAPGNLDVKIWKWFSHVMEELNLVESCLLMLLTMFDCHQITDDFLDVLRAGTVGDHRFLANRQLRPSLQRLVSLQLLQRRNDKSTQYICIPMAIQECLKHYLLEHQDQALILVSEGSQLLSLAVNSTELSSFDDMKQLMNVISRHCRAYCLFLNQYSVPLDKYTSGLLTTMPIYFLDQSLSTVCFRSKTQYWRTWLTSNMFALNELTCAEDDHTQYIEPTTLPSWILKRRGPASAVFPLEQRIRTSLYDLLWTDIRDCLILAVVGRAWHGIREEIFVFARNLQEDTYEDTLMREMIDAIDRGGCTALQSIAAECFNDETFKSKLMDGMGHETINEITKLIFINLPDDTCQISQDAVDSAVSKALEIFTYSSFFEIGGAFDNVLNGYFKTIVCNLLTPAITGTANPGGCETATIFALTQFSKPLIQERVIRVARGYWEVVGAMQIWLAANVLNYLSFSLMKDDNLSNSGAPSASRDETIQILITRTIELVREGTMKWENKRTPCWRQDARRAMYWCLEAESSRTGWGSVADSMTYSYQNQDRWEESCILMEVTKGTWPLL